MSRIRSPAALTFLRSSGLSTLASTVSVTWLSSTFSAPREPVRALDDDVAEPAPRGLQRDVDVVVEILGRLAAAGAAGRHALLDDADDLESWPLEHDGLADRVVERKQLVGRGCAPRTATLRKRSPSPSMRKRPRASSSLFTSTYSGVVAPRAGRCDMPVAGGGSRAGRRASARARVIDCDASGTSRSRLIGQAVVGDERPRRRRRIVRRLDAADDDVGRALPLDLVEGVLHRALAEGHQRDDRRDADDDAEDRQERAQLVQPQAAERQQGVATEFRDACEHYRPNRLAMRPVGRTLTVIQSCFVRRSRC